MDFLQKQAQQELDKLVVYVSPKKRKVEITKVPQPMGVGEIAGKAFRSAAIGSAMAGGLPYAITGFRPTGERIPLFGKPISLMEAGRLTEKELQKVRAIQRSFRAAALTGALLGGGYEVFKGMKQRHRAKKLRKMMKKAAKDPRKVGRFVAFSTPEILGAKGKSIKEQAVLLARSLKEVLKK